jgi:Protein of unknown function (DUF2934)
MLDRSVPKPTTSPGKKYAPPAQAIKPSHDQICQRAYELYESRGRQDGFSEQNWFEAEQELLARK